MIDYALVATLRRAALTLLAGVVLAIFAPATAAAEAPQWVPAKPFATDIFGFSVTWQSLQPAGTPHRIALGRVVRVYPPAAALWPLSQSESLYRLEDGTATFTLVDADTRVSSTGAEVPCEVQLRCYRVEIEADLVFQGRERFPAGAASQWCVGPPGAVLGVSCMEAHWLEPTVEGDTTVWHLEGETWPREENALRLALSLLALQIGEPTLPACTLAYDAVRRALVGNGGELRLRRSEAEKLIETLLAQRAALAPYRYAEGAGEALAWVYITLPLEAALAVVGAGGTPAALLGLEGRAACTAARIATVPQQAINVARRIRKTGTPLVGKMKTFWNKQRRLPRGSYRELDIRRKPTFPGSTRGSERVVVEYVNGRATRAWYTPDHYFTFIPIPR